MTSVDNHIERLLEGELEPLLLSVLDQSAQDEEFEALVASLRSSEELRKRACRFLCDESFLSELVGATEQASKLVELFSSENLLDNQVDSPPSAQRPSSYMVRFKDFVNYNGLAVAAAAMVVIIGLFVQNMLIMSKMSRLHSLALRGSEQPEVEVATTQQPANVNPDRTSDNKVVGHVIGLDEIQWRSDQRELTFGDTLREGQQLNIASGAIEILLANGAKITAEGPVDFEVSSLVTMGLDLGKVVAAVPRTARGYTIMTPTTEIVDIGTQFGISVDASGDTELHVFDGDVVARSLLDREESKLVHARENEAIGFNAVSAIPRNVEIRETDFLRQLGPALTEIDIPSLPVTQNLSLWFVADMIGDIAAGEQVSVWRDTLVGDNKFANDARQLDTSQSPSFTKDKRGFSALSFDGVSNHLLIDSLECDGSCTAFVVCRPRSSKDVDGFHGGYLFKQGLAPSLELSILKNRAPRGWLWPGPNIDRVGVVRGESLARKSPQVIAYRYDSAASRSELWANGVAQANAEAPIELSAYAPACIGGYCDPAVTAYYSGLIYELVVYNGSLNEQAMRNMHDYFKERYSVDSVD